MPLATIVAGPFSATFNAVSVGQQQDGFRLGVRFLDEDIRSNSYGDTIIDSVLLGADWFLQFTGIEYASMTALLLPRGPTSTPALGQLGQAGRLAVGSSLTKATVLTAVAGTTAASSPATLTASHAMVSRDTNTELLLACRPRFVPVMLKLYPYDSSGTVVHFTTT